MSIICFAFLLICLVGSFIVCAEADGTATKTIAAVLALCFAIGIFVIPFSINTVDTGEVAVVRHFGEAKEIRTPGIHYDFWVTNSYEYYDTKVQSIEINAATYSSDAQTMEIAVTLQYQVLADKVIDITTQYGNIEALENRITAIVTEKTKAVLSRYTAMEIIANRAAVSAETEQVVRDSIGEEYFVNIVATVITNIDFSDAFEVAVEDKMIAEQNRLKAEYENQKIVAQAQAAADAKLIEAEAEAEANRLKEASITDKILEMAWIEKWDGIMPKVVTGSEGTSLMVPAMD